MPVNYFLHNNEYDSIIKGELLREENITYSTNRNIKDTVFRLLMDDEEHLLSLFNALEGTQYKEKDLIRINTLKGALFSKLQNDLSFSLGEWYLSIVEHQSTITENAPIRQLLYIARIWEQLLELKKLYRGKLLKVPTPRAYLLYNGRADFPMQKVYRLSDAFWAQESEPPMELIVTAININLDKEHPLLEKCPILKEYSIFIARIRNKMAGGKNRDIAVKETIRECIEEGILWEFLNRHGKEVYSMLFEEITYEDIIQIRVEEAVEDAVEESLQQGRLEKTKSFIQNLLQRNLSDEDICALAECDRALIDEVRNQKKG
ncbi:Rpn family recombination-promoting nuclease/putative transposase [Anaerovorax odorimutans]|uniref:Rpn family recombination-promoting nuclease/putative transposase n=1 Tax=Anaerovorax odorimutans TaxID=109327 RepID=A0ABT1RST1_9FIRM|nr:Rpn family recombination-promoting nuclease/putative transposase [Anaerovorax odorimutans]MCQ4638268.1 Rpn family recombination-promoting nuclease/putative transposase [Anaerovorax odorimutans]